MQITKIKIKDNVTIEYKKPSKDTPNGGLNCYKIISKEEPTQEFINSLQALAKFVPMILEVPDTAMEMLKVKSITLTYKGNEDKLGFTISSNKEVTCSNSPANFNTPLVYDEIDGGNSDIPAGLFVKIEELIGHATDYVNGERADTDQINMFEPKEEAE